MRHEGVPRELAGETNSCIAGCSRGEGGPRLGSAVPKMPGSIPGSAMALASGAG